MSTTYILQELEKIESIEERKKEAIRLFRIFRDELPTHGINPPKWAGDMQEDGVKDYFQYAESFFDKIKVFCGGDFPDKIQPFYQEFQKNKSRTEELFKLPLEERLKLEIHDRFPYWNNFNKEIKDIFQNSYFVKEKLDLEKIEFLPKVIGKGGFATIYLAEDTAGKKYALKLFHPSAEFNQMKRGLVSRYLREIGKNIYSNQDFFSNPFFAELKAYNLNKNSSYEITCSLMDFISGNSIKKVIEEKIELSKETEGKILITYAEMLDSLHTKNKLFVDNNWGAAILNEQEVKICDYDFVSSIEDVSEDKFRPFEAIYGSRENYLEKALNFSSDLEQFSLMIDHLFFKRSFLGYGYKDFEKNKSLANLNNRQYPEEKLLKIPKQLGQIVPALINYPRDNSINAKDFISAIKEDYKL